MKKTFTKFYIVSLIVLLLVLNSCGKKGPLKLNPEVTPGKLVEMKIIQEGDDLRFSLKFPAYIKDKKTDFNISFLRKVYVYYSDKPLSTNPGNRDDVAKSSKSNSDKNFSSYLFMKKSRLLSKIDPRHLESGNGIYHYSYPKISGKFLNKKIYLAVKYKYLKMNSELSEIKEIKIIEPVAPVADLSLISENKVIKLKWSVKSKKNKSGKSPVISGFNIFRKIIVKDQDKNSVFSKINTDKILKEYYEDSDTGVSGKYNYYISVSATGSNISKPSNIVKVDIKDVFPPAVPQNFHVFKSKDGLMLSWQKVKDKDLSNYKIYRREGENSDFELLNSKIKENRFLDKTVIKGKKYFYYITSIDNNGNECDNSEERFEQF